MGAQRLSGCDACQPDDFPDTAAAVLARWDGIECADSYPCFVEKKDR